MKALWTTQFSEGFSAPSMTRVSTGPFWAPVSARAAPRPPKQRRAGPRRNLRLVRPNVLLGNPLQFDVIRALEPGPVEHHSFQPVGKHIRQRGHRGARVQQSATGPIGTGFVRHPLNFLGPFCRPQANRPGFPCSRDAASAGIDPPAGLNHPADLGRAGIAGGFRLDIIAHRVQPLRSAGNLEAADVVGRADQAFQRDVGRPKSAPGWKSIV